VVSVLVTGPKDRRFKPDRGDEFLRAIKIRSTPSFGWEVKPEAPDRKILLPIKKIPLSVNEMLRRYNSHSFRRFLLLAPR
jgi:hypothetical protein